MLPRSLKAALVAAVLTLISPTLAHATVVYVKGIAQGKATLRAQPATGGTVRTLLRNWSFGAFDWSADGRWIVTMSGPLNGKQKLVLIDMTSGATRTIARGFFSGASFSP